MAPTVRQILLILKRIVIVMGIAVAFALGLFGAIYLSLRSSETRVPNVIGKDRASAESTISDAGLNFRVRAERATSEAQPGTVLIQLPYAGEIVKVGQTVAVDISRPTANGESTAPANTNANTSTESKSENKNTNASAAETPTPKKKPANKNANENANANAANRNQNRNGNANRATPDVNANRAPTPANSGGNTNNENTARPPRNSNTNRRPVAAPTP